MVSSTDLAERKIQFEGDSTLVLAVMRGSGENNSIRGHFINDLRCLRMKWVESVLSHTQREGNSAAHRLARMGLSSEQETVWFEEPPDLIQDILIQESV